MIKEEDRELLINDLCSRLHYGVMCNIEGYNVVKLLKIEDDGPNTIFDFGDSIEGFPIQVYTSEVKPYLFPLSSMTGEQRNNLQVAVFQVDEEDELDTNTFLLVDWCNKHHFDYRGLIDKGLAIDCTNLDIY